MKLRDEEDGQYSFMCLGCGHRHHIATQEPFENGAIWSWNGSMDRPTFQPSYLCTGDKWTPPVTPENHAEFKAAPWQQTRMPYVCHSFIAEGRIQYLSDCTHEFSGQTVDLPEMDT